MTTRICIAGVGAVGATVAAHLTAAGEHVSLLARGERLAQLKRDGLQVDLAGTPVHAHLDVSDRPNFGIQDIVFLATKAHGLAALLPTLDPLIGPDTVIAPLVNGIPWWYFQGTADRFDGQRVHAVDPDGTLHGAVNPANLMGCVVYFTAQMNATGHVRAHGHQRLVVGNIGPDTSRRAETLAARLAGAGIATTASPRIRDELWTKVALNLATNPLSTLTGATLVELATDPRLEPMVSAILQETTRVAIAHGCTPTQPLDHMLATTRRAGAFETSMLQDHRAGRPLELDAIGHSVLELAHLVDQPMPTTRLILDLCAYRAHSHATANTHSSAR